MNYTSNPERVDRIMLASLGALLCISILMVFSTTAVSSQEAHGASTFLLRKHLLSIILGLLLCACSFRLRLSFLRSAALPLLIMTIVLLILVVIPSIGHSAGGARRWLVLGPIRLQPGEIAKFVMVVYMASYIGRHYQRMQYFIPGVGIPFFLLASLAGLLLLEPDFGTTVVISSVIFAQLLTASRLSHLLLLGAGGVLAGVTLILTSPYRMRRLTSFLDPFQDPSSSGYQLIQSLIAVGSGGVTGSGLGGGSQKLYYLPAAHTDFIFAVISEELGLIGAVVVLLLFLVLAYRGLYHAWRLSTSPFLCSLTLGCTLIIVVPALLNMAVVLGLLPTKGMVLPLVAFGGTAMLVHLGIMGVLLRLSVTTADEEYF